MVGNRTSIFSDGLCGNNVSENEAEIYALFPVDYEVRPSINIPALKLVVVFIYSFLSLAIFLNLRVIYMVAGILLSKPSSCRPDGNRHVFVYILSLSIVDSLVLAHLPLVATDIMLSQWIFGDAMCKLYWLIEQVNRILSTFILTALSADRFLAVCRPIRSTNWRKPLAALGIICVCVVVAVSLLAPTVVFSHVVEWDVKNHTISKCMFAADAAMLGRFLIYVFVGGYCIPFFCMVYFYANILYTLWRKHANPASANEGMEISNGALITTNGGHRRRRTAQHVTTRALSLVSFYFGCWTPYWMVQFFIHFALAENEMKTEDGVIIAIYAVHVLVYVNSAVNPFLYALLNKELQRQHSLTQRCRAQKGTASNDVQQRQTLLSCKKEQTNDQQIQLTSTQCSNGVQNPKKCEKAVNTDGSMRIESKGEKSNEETRK